MEDNNKGFKIIIGILLVILVVIVGIIFATKVTNNNTNNGDVDNNPNINDVDDNKDNNNDNDNNNNNDNSGSEKEDEEEPWGKKDNMATENKEYITAIYYISYPHYVGVRQRSGYVAEQGDGTMVLADSQGADSLVPNSVNDVLPLWFEQEVKNMSRYIGSRGDNFKFELNSQNEATINGRNMAKFTGNLTYRYERTEEKSHKWVAYSVHVEKNDTYALWMVFDISEDQSKGSLIEEHAYNMAKSFIEE